jgi:2-keto-4-pentenoate hydratase/2-oxohepta-3-ene-1,7-dioic acid hydratase in catechol pathway
VQSIWFNRKQVIPSKIVCIGRNYVAHIEELGNEVPDDMVVFNKPNSAISEQLLSAHQEPLHYEGELCFIVERGQLAGVGFGLDLTKRQLQSKLKSKGLPWERAKAFDGAALFSKFVKFDGDVSQLSIELSIDGELIQQGGVDLMMYKPAEIIEQLTSYTTLNDGDIIMTGTPAGVGKVTANSEFTGRVLYRGQCLVEATWSAD